MLTANIYDIFNNIPFIVTVGISYVVLMAALFALKATKKLLGILSVLITISMVLLVTHSDRIIMWISQFIK